MESSSKAAHTLATSLPGFGLPLNYHSLGSEVKSNDGRYKDFKFPSALELAPWIQNSDKRSLMALTSLREFTMLQIMDKITDKVDWHKKVFDDDITMKWREEGQGLKDKGVRVRMMDWVIEELRHKACIFEYSDAIPVYAGDVVKSDSALSKNFKNALQAAVKTLEDVPEKQKDWHPGSGETVQGLVHPSLWPLIYGRTRVLPDRSISLDDCFQSCGEGAVAPVPGDQDTYMSADARGNAYRKKFQWLPCEVDLSGERPRITSYINNLHPLKHKTLYGLIEDVIEAAIPLWGVTLDAMVECKWEERLRLKVKYNSRTGSVTQPQPPATFNPPGEQESFDLWDKCSEKGLQIIVKLANIELTPDKPKYEGDSWHIEGQLNERICATAIYYYSNHNVSGSRLMFRQQSNPEVNESLKHAGDATEWLEPIFGCYNDGPSTQVVGGVQTREGRLITFLNILQHQVQPFGLIDKKRPSHRKILALFLVDPHVRVLSTANVPPQQKEWSREGVEGAQAKLDQLPDELRAEVFKMVPGSGYPIDDTEAKGLRSELMEERKLFDSKADLHFGSSFGLCEYI